MKLENYTKTIDIPEGVQASFSAPTLTVTGPKGELKRQFPTKKISISVEGQKIKLVVGVATKREKMMVGTFVSHMKNMLKGVNEAYTYKLKVCASHFPMTVSADNGKFVVKNYIGEVVPRTLTLKQGVEVKVEGDTVVVESTDKEMAGQTASAIEQLCKRAGFDRRIFQDGIYITQKGDKEITL